MCVSVWVFVSVGFLCRCVWWASCGGMHKCWDLSLGCAQVGSFVCCEERGDFPSCLVCLLYLLRRVWFSVYKPWTAVFAVCCVSVTISVASSSVHSIVIDLTRT